jgi:ferric-dicitrate binding protein FerR (iron transport regulator)
MKVDDELIAKYLSGDASPEEAMALHDWLEAPENKAQFDEMEATWNSSYPSKNIRTVNKEEAWRKIKPTRSVTWTVIGIAAAITAILVLAFIGIQYFYWSSMPVLTKVNSGDSTRHVTLADNSQVTLYRNSEIMFSENISGDPKRIVKLTKGEAFFSVTKDTTKPFIVVTDFATIKVVGTQFNVIMRDSNVEVGVNEGLVLVYANTDSIYLGKGSTIIVKSGQTLAAQEMDANTWAYATQKLVFKNTPLNDIIKALEKTYRCTITVSNDNIKKCELSGTFDGDSVDKILLLISESLNLKLEQNGQVFTLEGEGCP